MFVGDGLVQGEGDALYLLKIFVEDMQWHSGCAHQLDQVDLVMLTTCECWVALECLLKPGPTI